MPYFDKYPCVQFYVTRDLLHSRGCPCFLRKSRSLNLLLSFLWSIFFPVGRCSCIVFYCSQVIIFHKTKTLSKVSFLDLFCIAKVRFLLNSNFLSTKASQHSIGQTSFWISQNDLLLFVIFTPQYFSCLLMFWGAAIILNILDCSVEKVLYLFQQVSFFFKLGILMRYWQSLYLLPILLITYYYLLSPY